MPDWRRAFSVLEFSVISGKLPCREAGEAVLTEPQKAAASEFVEALASFRKQLVAEAGSPCQEDDVWALVKGGLDSTRQANAAKNGTIAASSLRASLFKWQAVLTSAISPESFKWKEAWQNEHTSDLRTKAFDACATALGSFDETSTRTKETEPSTAALPQEVSQHWRMLTTSDFIVPSGSSVDDEARKYLRGKQWVPLWTARHGSVWRQDEIDKILRKLDDGPVLALHGPAGHGKSTLARQVICAWANQEKTAFIISHDDALDDPNLKAACQAAGRCLILLDDVKFTKALPTWLAWLDRPAVTLLQTIQTRELEVQKSFAGKLTTYRSPRPANPDPYIEKLIEFGAGHSSDREVVAETFRKALDRDRSGGLWAPFWEATRGEDLDSRIGRIVSEFFDDGARAAQSDAIAAVAFVNGFIEFSSDHPSHSRLDLEPRRSVIERLIENHPDLSSTNADLAVKELGRIGELLKGEFISEGSFGERLDHAVDPVIAFRSPSVIHAFYRWIFGAIRPPRDMKMSRWGWYDALLTCLRERNDGVQAHDYIGLLRSLCDSWSIHPSYRQQCDHGRSRVDLRALSKDIYDTAQNCHPQHSDKCRLDAAFSRALSLASEEPDLAVADAAELRRFADQRRVAATTADAPWDVLIGIADYLSSAHVVLDTTSDSDWESLIDRVLKSKSAPDEVKRSARYYRFKWYCLRERSINFAYLRQLASEFPVHYLIQDERNFLKIIHGYMNVAAAPHARSDSDGFLRAPLGSHPLASMVGVYALAVQNLARNRSFRSSLNRSIRRLGAPPHQTSNSILHGLATLIRRANLRQVPFRKTFGNHAGDLQAAAYAQVAARDFSELSLWLDQMALEIVQMGSPIPPPSAAPR